MGQGWVKIAATAAVIAACLTAFAAKADDTAAWLKDRQARFAAYQAAHPHPDAEIAKIKAKTAALIAAAPAMDPAQLDPPVQWKATDKPLELWDGPDYPQMLVMPAGEYAMGSPATEFNHQSYEAPRHKVRIGYAFAVGKYAVTVGEFARFVADTGYDAGDACFTGEGGEQPRHGRDWRNPSFAQTSDHPVVCMNWNDAQAYVAWLSKKTGHTYRLLSEAEYEYVDRGGTTTSYFWGEDATAACAYANGADADAKAALTHITTANTCHDGYVFTSPVGSFKPNPFGLYDITGNAWSWLADCWNENYVGAPTDGSINLGGDCKQRPLRRGSWSARPTILRAAERIRYDVDVRVDDHGIRVARVF